MQMLWMDGFLLRGEKPVLQTFISAQGSLDFQTPWWEADNLGALEAQSHPHGDAALEQQTLKNKALQHLVLPGSWQAPSWALSVFQQKGLNGMCCCKIFAFRLSCQFLFYKAIFSLLLPHHSPCFAGSTTRSSTSAVHFSILEGILGYLESTAPPSNSEMWPCVSQNSQRYFFF